MNPTATTEMQARINRQHSRDQVLDVFTRRATASASFAQLKNAAHCTTSNMASSSNQGVFVSMICGRKLDRTFAESSSPL